MDDEANNDSYHIHPKLPCYHLQVLNGDDFATDQTCNTKGRVPDGLKKRKVYYSEVKIKMFHKNKEKCLFLSGYN